jgi:hypothetical protein
MSLIDSTWSFHLPIIPHNSRNSYSYISSNFLFRISKYKIVFNQLSVPFSCLLQLGKTFSIWGNSRLSNQSLFLIEASRLRSNTPHLVEPFWTDDKPDSGTSTWQNATLKDTDIHAKGEIRTYNPSKQVASDPRLWSLGNWDKHLGQNWFSNSYFEAFTN